MRFFAGLIFLIIFQISVFAQKDKDKRVSESEVKQEEIFFSAYQKFLMADYEAAAKAFLKIAEEEKDPAKLAVIYFQLSRSYESLKDYTNSIKYGQKSVALNDKNEFYVMQLAEAYEANKELEKVAKLYADFSKQYPKEQFYYEKSVYAYLQVKDFESAIDVLDKMEKNLGVSETITHQKFEIYSKRNDSKNAIKELSKIIKAQPNETRFSLNLANYYLQIGKLNEAKSVFENVLKIDPTNETALRFQDINNNKTSSNEINYIRAISADIPNKQINLNDKIAKILPVVNQLIISPNPEISSEILQVTKLLTENYPAEAKSFAIHGDVLLHSGNKREAVEAYKSTLSLDGSVFEVWYQLMLTEKQLDAIDDLIVSSEEAILRFPNQGIAFLFQAYALNEKGNSKKAFEIAQEAMLFVGKNNDLRRGLKTEMAKSRFTESSHDLALKILDSEEINTSDAFELRGDILFKKGNAEDAVNWWKKALELEPTNKKLSEKISRKQL